jgi:hypothetical protein
MSAETRARPRVAQRWPRGAEGQRLQIRAAADDARDILADALGAVADNNPQLVRTYLAMIGALLADIQRLTVEARIGVEPTISEDE